ncbi:MAG: hypothetical protein HWD59_08595 [Coxiellaceae bacterium]|nr:MAG: hypothetical protein HWD59_08595 [Coxiellaceae bacterium]
MQKKSSLLQHGLFWLLLLVLLVLRRPDQLFHAYVWDEDKNIMLQWFDLGVIKTFLAPINGYLITISKLINFSALHISFLYYPEVSTALSILFDFLVLLMVAYSPNVLGWRKIAALSVVLIPASTEIQILPLYTFWFAGILLLVSLLWQFKQESKTWYAVRIIMMLLGGASSPLIVSLAPAFWLRLIYLRTIRETVIASIATVFALIQGWFVYTQSSYSQPSKMPWYELLKLSYDQFFGKFFYILPVMPTRFIG